MKYEDLRQFSGKTFTLTELKNFFQEASASMRNQLSRFSKKKKIIRLKKNYYLLPDSSLDPFKIGQAMVEPSYASLEMILSRRSIIPETAIHYTFITSQKPQRYSNAFGTFSYQHLPPHLFFGVERRSDGAFVATPEKALLDYLYLNSSKFKPDFKCWQAERFDELNTLDWGKMKEWAPKFGMKKLIKLVESLEAYSKSEAYQDHR